MKDQKPVMQNTFVRRLIPAAAAAGMSLTFAACGPTEPTEDNNGMAGNNMTPGNMTTPPNNTSPGLNGTIEEAELEAFCQSYSDCDPTSFMQFYTSTEDCNAQLRDYLGEFANNQEITCKSAILADLEAFITSSECIDGSFEVPEVRHEMLDADFQTDLARCLDGDGVRLDEAVVTTFCQGYVACGSDAFDSVEECVDDALLEGNAYLAELEEAYGASCANAFKAYSEHYRSTFTCQGSTFKPGDADPALEMAAEDECQGMP